MRKKMLGTGDDRISALTDDVLVYILLFLPTQDAVSTVVLSKRWRYVWTMLPRLDYNDSQYKQGPGKKESIWWFLDQSLKLHNAPVLESLFIELGPRCPVDVDFKELIAIAVQRKVRNFRLRWLSRTMKLPESLYVCDTLVVLVMSENILVGVPSLVCLPSLRTLVLMSLVYKDDDTLVRLLSGCKSLKNLLVMRRAQDNLKTFRVKVPSLKTLLYGNLQNMVGSLVIDSAALRKLFVKDLSGNSCSIENSPRFDKASFNVNHYLDDKFMRSLSSVVYLNFGLRDEVAACCKAIKFQHLIKSVVCPFEFDWLEPFMCFLQNSPQLKVLQIDQTSIQHEEDLALSFNQLSSVPGCLSNHLEIFEWNGYGGRNGEKEVVRYILTNSKCLKRVGISIRKNEDDESRKKIMTELESMPRLSTSSQLLFSTLIKLKVSIIEEIRG